MGRAELDAVIGMLRSGALLTGASFADMRQNMEAMTTAMPPPADVKFEPVTAGGVPAEWTSAPGAASDRVVLYLHGGGYCIGSINTHRMLVANISRASGARVLSLGYRLAPEHPHPAAVDDAVAAYRYLLKSGLAPAQIAIAGDSAGGGLAVATLIALRDAGDLLPAAAVCISPWLDLTQSGESMTSKAALDPMVQRDGLQPMADAYVGKGDPRAPTISPLFANLAGLPPLLVHVGTAETLLDDSTRFAERARKAGVTVDLEEWDDMIHVWHAFAVMLPEGQQAIDRIGEYLRSRFA